MIEKAKENAALVEKTGVLQTSLVVYVRLKDNQQKRQLQSVDNPSVIWENNSKSYKPNVTGLANKWYLLKLAMEQFRLPFSLNFQLP